MKKVERWQTDDGEYFDNERDAKIYELSAKIGYNWNKSRHDGLGFATVRDLVFYLKRDPDSIKAFKELLQLLEASDKKEREDWGWSPG